jgi:hypothetical protein
VQPSKVTLNFCKAAENGNLEMMGIFLQQGADINSQNCSNDGETALIRSVNPPYFIPDVFEFLLTNNAEPNLQSKTGETALMNLVTVNSVDSVLTQLPVLFDHGAKVDIEDNHGNTALDFAVSTSYSRAETMNRSLEYIRYLVSVKSADINHKNKSGETPLMISAKGCGGAEVKLLLELGANTEIRDQNGDTALAMVSEKAAHESSHGTCIEVVRILQNAKDYVKSNSTVETKGASDKTTISPLSVSTPQSLTLIEIVKKFELNKTTYSQVTSELGEPISFDRAVDTGNKYIYYAGMTAPFNAITNIRVADLFGQSATTKAKYIAVIIFDKNDLLTGYKIMPIGNFKK